jgi:hypothetical protein
MTGADDEGLAGQGAEHAPSPAVASQRRDVPHAGDRAGNAATVGTTTVSGDGAEAAVSGPSLPPRRRRRLWLIAAVVTALLLVGGAVLVASGLSAGGPGNSESTGNGGATSLATVQRRTLSTRTQFNGTWGYASSYTVLARAPGTVTWLPRVGEVIRDGQVLYRVNGAPVVLLYGPSPAWRTLAEGATAGDVAGPDVAQLNHDLVALGYVDRSEVGSAWDEFTWATRSGVERLQEQLGVVQTGRLALADVVFLPTAARVTSLQATLGGPASGRVLTATSTTRTVTVGLDPSLRSEVKTGDRVTIVLPDGSTTPGRVMSVGRVASTPPADSAGSDSGPTVQVRIRPLHPSDAGSLDQALVEVTITDQTVRRVLAVPVAALLARAGGGYAVEIVDGDGAHRLAPVRVGLFDDAAGRVQVSGPGLAAGQRVVVPGHG